jgi:hypothetical protein
VRLPVPLLADSGPFLWLFSEEGLDASRENDHAPSAHVKGLIAMPRQAGVPILELTFAAWL